MRMKVPFHWIDYDQEDVDAALAAIESNIMSPRGPKLEEFGQAWARYVGKAYGWPLSSGTGAIHCALLALGIGRGWTVFVPSYTCSPTVFPVSYVGAQPYFVDCEFESYGMDPDALIAALEGYRFVREKAVIVTHLYGSSCHGDVIRACKRYGAVIVEDACENAGGKYRDKAWEDRYQGSLSEIGCFSFRGDKMLTSLGTGGMCVTDSEKLLQMVKFYSDLGLHNDSTVSRYRDLPVVGYNYEISNVAAAFGLSQIRNLETNIQRRRKVADMWRSRLAEGDAAGGLADGDEIVWMDDYPGHCYYQFPLMFKGLKTIEQFDDMTRRIEARGVALIPPFWPMHLQPMYRGLKFYCPNAEYASTHVLMFPCYGALSSNQVDYMVTVVVEEYKKSLS